LAFPEAGLSDGSIALRLPRVQDAADLARGVRDPAIVRFASVPWADDTADELAEKIATEWPEAARAGRMLNLSIRDAETDAVLGFMPVFGVSLRYGHCEVGFFLLPTARGRGAAARAVRLVVAWVFDELGLERMQATTDIENVPAQRTLENAGFQREGVLRSLYPNPEGGRFDCLMYSRLASDVD
jgi:RimJ/RimL family protein N-acetyltransferase